MLLGCASTVERDRPLSIGEGMPSFRFEAMGPDVFSLGLEGGGEFGFEDVAAELIVLDVLNVYCAACQEQAPVMNELYDIIQADETLRDQIAVMAIASGNEAWEIEKFKIDYKVDFPIFPDPKYDMTRSLGVSSTPYHLSIRKKGNEMIVAGSHRGIAEDALSFLTDLRHLLELDMAALKRINREDTARNEPPPLIIDNTELRGVVETAMSGRGWNVQNLEDLTFSGGERVFVGTLLKGGATKKLFAQLVLRESICETCESIQFFYIFDRRGRLINIVPIQLTKYDNVIWNEEDLKQMKRRILGRFVYDPFDFDPRVDAVTTATITSAMIFDSLDRSTGLYRELKSKGYLK
jgi:hypothetical protein